MERCGAVRGAEAGWVKRRTVCGQVESPSEHVAGHSATTLTRGEKTVRVGRGKAQQCRQKGKGLFSQSETQEGGNFPHISFQSGA